MCAGWWAEVSLEIGTSLEQSKCCVPLLAAEKKNALSVPTVRLVCISVYDLGSHNNACV